MEPQIVFHCLSITFFKKNLIELALLIFPRDRLKHLKARLSRCSLVDLRHCGIDREGGISRLRPGAIATTSLHSNHRLQSSGSSSSTVASAFPSVPPWHCLEHLELFVFDNDNEKCNESDNDNDSLKHLELVSSLAQGSTGCLCKGGTELLRPLLLPFELLPAPPSFSSPPPAWFAEISLLPILPSLLSLALNPPLFLLPLPLFEGTASNTGNLVSPSAGHSPSLLPSS